MGPRRDYSSQLPQQLGLSLPSSADAQQAEGAAYCFRIAFEQVAVSSRLYLVSSSAPYR